MAFFKNLWTFLTETIFLKDERNYRNGLIRWGVRQYKLLFYTARGLDEHDTLVRSAALTFYTLMSIVPIAALVFAVVIFVTGSGWPVALGLAVGGAVSELARKALGYGRFAGVAVGYALFETCWAAGLFVPMFASQDYYRELMGSNSIDPAYMEALLSTVTPETFAIIAVVTFAGGIIGSLVGRAVFKKHLERAGIA